MSKCMRRRAVHVLCLRTRAAITAVWFQVLVKCPQHNVYDNYGT